MKQLILMRHAKTETHSPSGEDRMRALTARGQEDALKASEALLETYSPDHILCSDATRTTQTAEVLLGHRNTSITYDETLYLASPGTLLQAIHNTHDMFNSILIIGHNPGIHELAFSLVTNGEKEAMQRLSLHYPTSAFAVIEGKWRSWEDVAPASGNLTCYNDRKSF